MDRLKKMGLGNHFPGVVTRPIVVFLFVGLAVSLIFCVQLMAESQDSGKSAPAARGESQEVSQAIARERQADFAFQALFSEKKTEAERILAELEGRADAEKALDAKNKWDVVEEFQQVEKNNKDDLILEREIEKLTEAEKRLSGIVT